jgi:hypothetical protein
MDTTETMVKFEVWHKNFNVDKKDNLLELPTEKALFGIFGIVDEEPINCRYVSEVENFMEMLNCV